MVIIILEMGTFRKDGKIQGLVQREDLQHGQDGQFSEEVTQETFAQLYFPGAL